MNSSLTFNKELLLALAGLAILIVIPFIFPSRVALDFVIRLAAFGLFATSLNMAGWCLLDTPCFLAAGLMPLVY
jgi:branched-chain amino acid transport system permease protein